MNKFLEPIVIILCITCFGFLSSCKKVPNLAANESDPNSPNYRPDPPQNLVTFKNYDKNSVGISWRGTNDQPISGYIISVSKTGNENSYKKVFEIDPSEVSPDNIYEVFTPLIHKSTKEFYKTETYYVNNNDTVFSDPVYSTISQYVYGFHSDFVSDSTPNFQLYWDHSFINNDVIEVQISGDSVNFETIYSGPISKKFFYTSINYSLNDSFLRFRIKTENEYTDYFPINIDNKSCLEYFDDVFFYRLQNGSTIIKYGSNNFKYTFDNSTCEINEIVLLEGGFNVDRPLREIKRVSKTASSIGVENLQNGINYYFWLVAETDNGTSSLTKAYEVRF